MSALSLEPMQGEITQDPMCFSAPFLSLRKFSPHMMSLSTQQTHRGKHPGQLLNLGTAKFYFDSVPATRNQEP